MVAALSDEFVGELKIEQLVGEPLANALRLFTKVQQMQHEFKDSFLAEPFGQQRWFQEPDQRIAGTTKPPPLWISSSSSGSVSLWN